MVSDDPETSADLDGHGDGITWNDLWNAGTAIFTAGSAVAASAVTAATVSAGGVILGAELEAADLGVTYPHEPCSCPVDAVDPPFIQAPMTKSDSKPGTLGAPDHQQTADEEAAKMGPNGQREVTIPTPGVIRNRVGQMQLRLRMAR